MPLAVIELNFDPLLRVGGVTVPWETVALAGVILLMLVTAALIAGRTPTDGDERADDGVRTDNVRTDDDDEERPAPEHLRRDDVLLVALGVLPGAIAGARLAYALVHLDYYQAVPGALVDPGLGNLSLSGAVAGGTATGAAVAHLLGPSIGRWMRVATVPMLLGLALGKAALILGGEGQGSPSAGPLAVRFGGDGPWPDPSVSAVASQPAQLYETAAVLLVLLVVMLVFGTRLGRDRGGRLFGLAIALWALGRFVVAFSWADPTVLGPLRAEQLLCVAISAGSLVLVGAPRWLGRGRRRSAGAPGRRVGT